MENKILARTLDRIISSESKKIVGKVCRRIETIKVEKLDSAEKTNTQLEITKEDIKNLLYEFCRDLRDILQEAELGILNELTEKSKEK